MGVTVEIPPLPGAGGAASPSTQEHPMTDLWDSICQTAQRRADAQRPKPRHPTSTDSPESERALERALLEALCGGMVHWTNDAQVFVLHHWHCQSCGASGQFPNIEGGRMLRRHNRAGTQWTCHDPNASPTDLGPLPREFQHHHHNVSWCQHCVSETPSAQSALAFTHHLPPCHISPGSAMRTRSYV
jgi:hypothetical protein